MSQLSPSSDLQTFYPRDGKHKHTREKSNYKSCTAWCYWIKKKIIFFTQTPLSLPKSICILNLLLRKSYWLRESAWGIKVIYNIFLRIIVLYSTKQQDWSVVGAHCSNSVTSECMGILMWNFPWNCYWTVWWPEHTNDETWGQHD